MLNNCLIFILVFSPLAHFTPLRPIEEWMKASLKEVNNWRKMHGVEPDLCLNKHLNRSAEDTARWLVERRGTFEHNLIINHGETMKLYGFDLVWGNENLAVQWGSAIQQPYFPDAIEGWKTSKGHNTTMLSPFYTHIGFGEAISDDGTYVVAVQHFALSGTEPCDYKHPANVQSTLPLPDYAAAGHRRSNPFAYDASGKPLYKPLYDAILKKLDSLIGSGLLIKVSLESIVRKNWNEIHRLPHDTPGYRKCIELGGNPSANKPSTPPKSSSASPSTTAPARPTCPRAAKLAEEMAKQERKQGGCPFAKQASPNDLNRAIIEHDQNSAMGQQQSSAEGLQQRLLEPQMILLISGAIVALGLLWYFRGQLFAFIRSAYEKTVNWIFGVKKNQRVGTDALAKEAKNMAKLVAKKNSESQPLRKRSSTQILGMMQTNIPFDKFKSLLGDAVRDLNFHHLEILLENMPRIVNGNEIVRPKTNSLSMAKANAILDYITMGQVPSSLLETFILKSGHYSGKSLSPEIRQVIKKKLALRPPIYQTSALIVLGKYRLSPEDMEISVSTKYEKYVNPQFAQMVTKLVQNYFKPQKNLRLDKGRSRKLQYAEIAMLEKLLKGTKCINPRMKNKLSCLPLVETIQSFGSQITNRLQTISAPHLAYLLNVRDEEAYENDLGMFMLAKGELGIPNSSGVIRPEAQLLRIFSQRQRTKYPACRNPNDRTDVKAFPVPPKWKSQIDTLNVEVRRGFARALIYWGLQIPPYALPRIRFADNDLPSMFRDYLKAYCGQKKQVPATSIVFLDEDPKKKRIIKRQGMRQLGLHAKI